VSLEGPREQICGVVLLRDDGSALLQLRDNKPEINDPGMWVFPGGHCEPGETRESCAAREFFEETRYRCQALKHLVSFSAGALGYRTDFLLDFYWDRFDGVQAYTCCEGQDLRFLTLEDAKNLPMPAYLRKVWELGLRAAAI
jgi:8-oxo-dGTP pyrophosphatase MutT (NUDIX family)